MEGKFFSNWSGVSAQANQTYMPVQSGELDEIFESKQPFTFRGLGKNYTDAGLSRENVIWNMRSNQILSFDENLGIVRVQSGVVLHHLLMLVIPKGWIVPTIPGTAYVTMGGMVASNVHGKNQYRAGSIGDYVQQFVLRTPAFGKVICSPTENREWFDATIGGMGTTGFIEEIELRLQKIQTPFLNTNYIKTKNIDEQIQIMESKRSVSDFTIGWMDHLSLKQNQIHGLIEHARYSDQTYDYNWNSKISFRSVQIPFYMPVSLVNHCTSKIFNTLSYAKPYPCNQSIHFYEFNFKLDKLRDWNRLYGSNGLIQYQCLIPKSDQTSSHVQHVLSYLREHDVVSSLVVVKLHRKDPFGNLSFSRDGVSVAMDFPYHPRSIEVLRNLNPWVIDIGGRVYLTKDRTMTAEQFEKMYSSPLSEQRKILNAIDPHKKMESLFSKRLKIRE